MLQDSKAFSSFSVNDLVAAKTFYGQTLGLNVEEGPMGLTLKVGGSNNIFIYPKEDHTPAAFTILNFLVDDIDQAVDELADKDVTFEQYDLGGGAKTDEKDVMRGQVTGQGPDIAWFKDPAGNVLSVLHDE